MMSVRLPSRDRQPLRFILKSKPTFVIMAQVGTFKLTGSNEVLLFFVDFLGTPNQGKCREISGRRQRSARAAGLPPRGDPVSMLVHGGL
jgi:hypothetical protein